MYEALYLALTRGKKENLTAAALDLRWRVGLGVAMVFCRMADRERVSVQRCQRTSVVCSGG